VLSPSEIAELAPETIRPLRRAEYDRMVAQGLFDGEKLELLRGVLVAMTPQDAPHAAVVQRLTELFTAAIGGRASVRIQLPLAISEDSEPEPDVAIVPRGDYDDAHPATALLVIEVAQTSLSKDRSLKAELYAASGIPEYWVVDIPHRLVQVHAAPAGGRYREVATVGRGQTLRPRSFPDVEVAVSDVVK
jgi:Uma2 family endonuclease